MILAITVFHILTIVFAGPRSLRRHPRLLGCLRLPDLAQVREEEQSQQPQTCFAWRPDLLSDGERTSSLSFRIFVFYILHFSSWKLSQIRDIRPDEELLLGERQPIQLDGGEESADKVEEEEEEEEEERKQQVRENSLEEDDVLDEEDNTVKCLVCDKAFPDVYM